MIFEGVFLRAHLVRYARYGAMTPLVHLDELFAKLDAFFLRTKEHVGSAITCHAGCDDCCKRRFTITSVEAAKLRTAIEQLPLEERRSLRERASRQEPACPLLGRDGRCAAYAARPTICRTHGLPIRFPAEKGIRALPMIDACPKNFGGMKLEKLDSHDILDQSTASTILAAIDAGYADSVGLPRGERIAIVDICRAAAREDFVGDG
jgi:uncharacterized protein